MRQEKVEKVVFDTLQNQVAEICRFNIKRNADLQNEYKNALYKIDNNFEPIVCGDIIVCFPIKDCETCKKYFQPKLAQDSTNIDLTKNYFGYLRKFDCKKDSEYYRMIVKRAELEPNVQRSLIYTAGNIKLKEKDYVSAIKFLERAFPLYVNEPEKQEKIAKNLNRIEVELNK